MSYDYTGYQVQLGTLMGITSADPTLPPSDEYFAEILPACIDYSEQRIYRDLDIQSTTTEATCSTTSGNPQLSMPSDPVVYVVEAVTILTRNGQPPPIAAPTNLVPVDKGFLYSTYPQAYWATALGQPEYYYVQDQNLLLLGPSPDATYEFNVTYTYRPTPLSSTNTTTILTEMWPDLFLAASMVFMSGYQKNFGSQSDDPRMAVSWEAQYQTLLKGALEEEARKKNMGVNYTPLRVATFTGRARPNPPTGQ